MIERPLKFLAVSAAVGLVIAIVIGGLGQATRTALRPTDPILPVTAEWIRSLPVDADRATKSYIDRVPAEMQDRGEAVSRSRYAAWVSRTVVSLGAMLLFLASGAASALEQRVRAYTRRPVLQSLLFALVMLTWLMLVSLPVEAAMSYVRYRRFGFADQAFSAWLLDYAVGWFIQASLTALGIAAVMFVICRFPRRWFWWGGAIYLVLASLYLTAEPVLIDPLFNDFTSLPDSDVKSGILSLAHSAGISVDDVYTADASRQSRLLNAHVSGILGTARISIDDSTLAHQYPPAVLAVTAHEIGHYVMHHNLLRLVLDSLLVTSGLALTAWLGPKLIGRHRRHWRLADMKSTGAIAVLWLFVRAWGVVSEPIMNAYVRMQEAQADDYSLELARAPEGLAEFMIHDADTARLEPTWLDVALFHTHPAAASRVENAMRWREARIRAAGLAPAAR